MKHALTKKWMRLLLTVVVLGLPGMASAQMTFSSIVVFGDSLSDPGNAFALLAHPIAGLDPTSNVSQSTPPYDTLDEFLVPEAPYARGGHHFSNGATWIEQFAQARGLSADVGPAFQHNSSRARNYAVGGARAIGDYPDRVNLPIQVGTFLTDVGGTAPSDALYVIEIGGNDLFDALAVYLGSGSAAAAAIITDTLQSIYDNIQTLYGAGARKFLVWNAPRIDSVPAVTVLGPGVEVVAGDLTTEFNNGLTGALSDLSGSLGDIEIAQLDITGEIGDIFASPGDYGLTNDTEACVTPDTPPYTCQQPDNYFFWDGIHPTKAVHAIFSQFAAGVLAQYPGP